MNFYPIGCDHMKQLLGSYPAPSLAELEARLHILEIRVARLTELVEAGLLAIRMAEAGPDTERPWDHETC
jgi:hypothetical protein